MIVMQKAIKDAIFLNSINADLSAMQDELQKSAKISSGYPVPILIPMGPTHGSDTFIP